MVIFAHVLYTWTGTSGNKEVESFLNEANVMKHLSAQKCEYIIQLVGVQVEQAPAMIAMELAPGGNLLDILKSSWMMVCDTHTHTHVHHWMYSASAGTICLLFVVQDEEEDCVFSSADEDNKSLEGVSTSVCEYIQLQL